MSKEWIRFKVGKPSTTANWVEPDCVPFDLIYHYTHLETALAAIREENPAPRKYATLSISYPLMISDLTSTLIPTPP
ncbi:MAG: hypothetical protein ABSF91_08255 [Bacteroidota bacterium]|jgi:hypothetical protein